MRIEQYFLLIDYSLWEVILNGDSPTPTRVVNGVVQPIAPTIAEQRLAKKNELKRFGGNKETKKVQKTLLKQQYENFSGSSSESLDQIHDRLQKLISQLEILVSVVSNVSAASTKPPASILPNMDNLRDGSQVADGHADHESQEVSSEDWKSPRDTRNKDTQRGNVLMETSTSNALVLQYVSVPTSPVHDRYKSGEGYHVVPPPYTGTFMPPKPNLVFHYASTVSETVPTIFNVEPSTTKPFKDLSQSNRPSAPFIEDWVSDSKDESKGEPMPTQKALVLFKLLNM
nr:hypothetical protein [Tanacetum cinerariifolium]